MSEHETYLTDAFHEHVLSAAHDGMARKGFEEPPLFGSLEDTAGEVARLSACGRGHILYACNFTLVDAATRDRIARHEEGWDSDEEDEDEDEEEEGEEDMRCAFYGR